MGHAINYGVCDKKSQIMGECCEYAARNVDRGENPSGSYHGCMSILEHEPIKASYDDAVEFLRKKSEKGFYDDYAVRFYDTDAAKVTKKMENLEARKKDMYRKQMEYADAHSVTKHKSKQIGCDNCGSKITISYLRGERCPVCGKDLRAAYIIERLNKFTVDIKSLDNEIANEKKKQKEKCPVKWCYKVEVHC